MFRSIHLRRMISRAALLAVLASALLPTLGHANTGPSGWIEICTAEGIAWQPRPDDPPPQRAAGFVEHCAYCLTPTDDAVPVAAHGGWIGLRVRDRHRHATPESPHLAVRHGACPLARAPPARV
jgi:hypothetical protein